MCGRRTRTPSRLPRPAWTVPPSACRISSRAPLEIPHRPTKPMRPCPGRTPTLPGGSASDAPRTPVPRRPCPYSRRSPRAPASTVPTPVCAAPCPPAAARTLAPAETPSHAPAPNTRYRERPSRASHIVPSATPKGARPSQTPARVQSSLTHGSHIRIGDSFTGEKNARTSTCAPAHPFCCFSQSSYREEHSRLSWQLNS